VAFNHQMGVQFSPSVYELCGGDIDKWVFASLFQQLECYPYKIATVVRLHHEAQNRKETMKKIVLFALVLLMLSCESYIGRHVAVVRAKNAAPVDGIVIDQDDGNIGGYVFRVVLIATNETLFVDTRGRNSDYPMILAFMKTIDKGYMK
jgi:hypothetical protein